jgi:hypothetical protein
MAAPVWAQQVKIAFHDGQVSVETVGAPPRMILAEWSKIGGTNIVNAERVTGAPLTLKLVDVPEAQALEIILRSVAGYMAAPRGRTPGVSLYDRILVLPTASTQVAASPTVARPNQPGPFGPANQRFVQPRPAPQPVEEAPDVEEPPEPAQTEPVFTFPQPNQPNGYRSVPVQPVPSPAMMTPETPAGAPPPAFGVVGAPMPGMIQVPPAQPQPQPAQPVTPGRPTRPPGQ